MKLNSIFPYDNEVYLSVAFFKIGLNFCDANEHSLAYLFCDSISYYQ